MAPFWNNDCQELSNELWIPEENNWNIREKNKLFTVEEINNELLPDISEPTYDTDIFIKRTRKIRIYPNVTQAKILKHWYHTTRKVYNNCLGYHRDTGTVLNFQNYRNKFVTKSSKCPVTHIPERNKNVKKWMITVPKDVRAGAVDDLCTASDTEWKKYKRGELQKAPNRFTFKFRKRTKYYSFVVPKSAIYLDQHSSKNGKIHYKVWIYRGTYIKSPIRMSHDRSLADMEIHSECRISWNRGQWFFHIPIDIPKKTHNAGNSCGIDPNVKNIHVIYGNDRIVKVSHKKEILNKIRKKLDGLRSLRSKKILNQHQFKIQWDRNYKKLNNLKEDIQWRNVHYLVSHYDTIYLPKFPSQKFAGRLDKYSTRNLLEWRHYAFRKKLESKVQEFANKTLDICQEHYTTKTCGSCGNVNYEMTNEDIYECSKCDMVTERDINAARNILIKNHLML